MYFFRTFKQSTAPYKVHNMGLRYIKTLLIGGERESLFVEVTVSTE